MIRKRIFVFKCTPLLNLSPNSFAKGVPQNKSPRVWCKKTPPTGNFNKIWPHSGSSQMCSYVVSQFRTLTVLFFLSLSWWAPVQCSLNRLAAANFIGVWQGGGVAYKSVWYWYSAVKVSPLLTIFFWNHDFYEAVFPQYCIFSNFGVFLWPRRVEQGGRVFLKGRPWDLRDANSELV